MNTAKIKAYARQARRDFIQAVTEKAHMLGLSKEKIEPAEVKGDYAIIDGRPFPKTIEKPRQHLIKRIKQDGFELVMRSVAYTWFNRFVALRYMELHDYLDYGYRVLSNRNGSEVPEILEHAAELDFPGLNKDKVVELRLAGDKDNELYRLLIFAQCDALHRSMPFLFEKINHETELLLPDNLLHSNSPIRKLVQDIDASDWENVEIIGWIYQFYISEKKDEVIGKVVKSEDIPAATQLFTPNWIVKYMVQNTLGRQWLTTYPDSSLRDNMEYYIEPAEQTEEVQKQFSQTSPESIDPESLTMLDPACGSGHILVEAYDIFKAIYQERGYRKRDIPKLILEKNLYGLEICDRAAQLAGFALMMKARADDRRILNGNLPKLKLMAIQSSAHIDAESLAKILLKEKVIRFKDDDKLFPDFEKQRVLTVTQKPEVSREDIVGLMEIYKQSKTLGSLITVPEDIAEKLDALKRIVDEKLSKGNLFEREAANKLIPYVRQSVILWGKYDFVIENPPYMGRKSMNKELKLFARNEYKGSDSDTFSVFIVRSFKFLKKHGAAGFVSPFVWLFIKSYLPLRRYILTEKSILNLVQPSYTSFFESAIVPLLSFVILNSNHNILADYFDLGYLGNAESQPLRFKELILNPKSSQRYKRYLNNFFHIPGYPITYRVSDKIFNAFKNLDTLSTIATTRKGMVTGDNDRRVRLWYEVSLANIGFGFLSRDEAKKSGKKWFPYIKGGGFKKWFGNNISVVNWENDGHLLQNTMHPKENRIQATNFNLDYIFKKNVNWGAITSTAFSARISFGGELFDAGGSACFPDEKKIYSILAFLNSRVASILLNSLNPTLNFQAGNIADLPILQNITDNITNNAEIMVKLAKSDWDSYEISWDFQVFPFFESVKDSSLLESYQNWENDRNALFIQLQKLETKNNQFFIDGYNLQDELSPEVTEEQITLVHTNRENCIKNFISYSIGCMMGRYGLDEPGLIYAHSGNNGFDPSRYKTFPADDDGIIPIMDLDWFPDDAANRFTEFLKVAWPPDTLEENLKFVADSLKPKRGETPTGTIRRYLCTTFFKDHLKTYKKRPIYWLFSSGKLKAFECLVYLHRYNESTLSRIRSSYVTPLQGKFNARIDYLRNEIEASSTASTQKKLQKELDLLKKKKTELSAFDDELRHYADMRITLDLNDGVKVNYGKFGNLLAEKKTVTGKK